MKQIELNLQKRLLIVEAEPEFEPKEGVEYYVQDDCQQLFILPKGKFKLICKGSELTEEIASNLVYGVESKTDLQSFISAIMHQLLGADENPNSEEKEWQESESKTFNPDKTLIFEIL